MDEKEKRTVHEVNGEWTVEGVILMGCDAYVAANRIADEHNATIAAERETTKFAQDHIDIYYKENQQLREQLDAEREKVRTLVDALREVNALARGNMTGCGTCNHVIDATIKVL